MTEPYSAPAQLASGEEREGSFSSSPDAGQSTRSTEASRAVRTATSQGRERGKEHGFSFHDSGSGVGRGFSILGELYKAGQSCGDATLAHCARGGSLKATYGGIPYLQLGES